MGKFKLFICICSFLLSYRFLPVLAVPVTIEDDHFMYEIAPDGRNLHFIDKTTGVDYLYTDTVSYCASVIQDGKEFGVTSASLVNNQLLLKFGNSGVTAEINLEKGRDRITMEVIAVKGVVESLTFLNVPLKLEGMPYEPFAACVLSMNLFTHVRQLPALQTFLWATCYRRFGIQGAKIVLVGVPQKEILPVIRSVMEQAEDIPHSDQGGAWAQMQKEGYGSYLMNFGTLTEETVPDWITMCRSLGFNQIDSHGGDKDFFSFGDFELNPEKWPGGWDHFKRINQQLHEAGISSIFHTYAFFIDKKSKYARPVPHPDLGYFNSFTLIEPVGPDDDEIVVKESTEGISTVTGFFVRNSTTLRIGGELVRFSGVTNTPPYKFTGCTRGVNKTKASSHAVQDTAYHLREMFGRFVPGIETPLFREIAQRTAEIVNECDFDGIYFDAIDGSDILGGAENSWYYGTQFIFEVAKHLKRPVGMEMSAMFHHWWHYRSRWQAWDRPVRGYKRFIDIHTAAIKTNEYEHGLWKGHLPLINQYAKAENGGLLLPLHLGWWGNQTWAPPQVEPTFPDDIEYLCCKMIGNNAGLSMLGGTDKKTLEENPLFGRSLPLIKQYEELRHQNYFSDTVRSILRQPGKEFTLFQDKNSKWNFKPIVYQKHKIAGTDHPSARWTVQNDFSSRPVRLRIELLMSVKSYDNPKNIVLTGFSGQEEFANKGTAEGVSGKIMGSKEKSMNGEVAGIFSACSSGASPREGSWICMEKKFDPWLNLGDNQALGVWLNGDGNGEILNFRIESPKHISHGARGDHFVKIDFTGWKYFELVEIESSEFSNYIWPESGAGFYVYDTYRHTVDFQNVDKLQLWYNNLPGGKEIKCLISPVKALPMVPATIENPSVSIGGEKIVFPGRMESGMYLELNSPNDCKLYGSKGELLREIVPEGKIPNLITGENEISFSCDGPKDMNARVQVTVISEGEPLDIK
ncbi:MAG: hypothetical protein ABFD10_04840 [Prolixibacteraceae bacterium]